MSLITDHLREFEGLELTAYQDVAGVWTIGYGHTGPDVHKGLTITQDQAEELLYRDLAWVRKEIEQTVKVKLTICQEAAITGLIYNIGGAAWRKSTCLKRLNNGNPEGAAEALTWFNKARVGGELKVVPGLVRRREAERQLFLNDTPRSADSDNKPVSTGTIAGGESKPLGKSKEVGLGLGGFSLTSVFLFWGDLKKNMPEIAENIVPYLPWVLAAFFAGIVINRILASYRGDR